MLVVSNMALAYALSEKGTPANELETKASVSVDLTKGGITSIELKLNATTIEGLSSDAFLEVASAFKQNCLISKALTGVAISLIVNCGAFQSIK
jgi:osmotically inducible protein OsmC